MHLNHFVTFFKMKKHYKLVAFKNEIIINGFGSKT